MSHGALEAVLENTADRISSRPDVEAIELRPDRRNDGWVLSVDRDDGVRVAMRTESFSDFSQTFDLDVEAFLRDNPRVSSKTRRYSMRYPELETSMLRLVDFNPGPPEEPFADRMASGDDLSEPQRELLETVRDDIDGCDADHTYSTRLPRRVDPRTLDKLEEKGYVICKYDDHMVPPESAMPTPKRIRITPSGRRRCKASRRAGCGCGGNCGDCDCDGGCGCRCTRRKTRRRS